MSTLLSPSLPLTVKLRIARALTHPQFGRALAAVLRDRIHNGGLVFDTASPLIDPSTKAALFWGLYERAEVRFVERYLSPDRDVIELGSSLGILACHVKRRIGPARRLICIEANALLCSQIRRNLELNNLYREVTVLNRAVNYDEGRLFLAGRVTTDGRLTRVRMNGSVPVQSITLSGVVREFGITEYGLVCDIEGAEAGMILRDREAFAGCRQLIIEMHTGEVGSETVTVDALQAEIIGRLGMALCARRGPVACFIRPGAS